jgi:acetyl-CoA synthetase
VASTPSVRKVLVVRRTGRRSRGPTATCGGTTPSAPRATSTSRRPFDAEHPLFILYTSGTTGKPKGILHTSGGYLTQTSYTHRNVFDLRPEKDVYWCTADSRLGHRAQLHRLRADGQRRHAGDLRGHAGHPAQAAAAGRSCRSTASRSSTRADGDPHVHEVGRRHPQQFDLSSLRVLGSVGEPINPEAWVWYRRVIGGDRTPVVDTWWQTETGAIMISPLPGVTEAKPGSAQVALPGIGIDVVNDAGEPVANGSGGYLVLTEPWPSMLRGIWGDPERFKETYWSRFEGMYFAGDGAKKDEDGDIWLLGRVDDVMNVSGHRSPPRRSSRRSSRTRRSPRLPWSAPRTRPRARRCARS